VPRSGYSTTLGLIDWLAATAHLDAGLPNQHGSDRAGVVIGLSKGWIDGLSLEAGGCFGEWENSPHPSSVPPSYLTSSQRDAWLWAFTGSRSSEGANPWLRYWPDGAARRVAAAFGFQGPCLAPVAACATGLVAVLQGADLIRRGVCDLVFAGAVDASLHPLILGAFARMGALARVRNSCPGQAIRPWDRDRSGFLVGEGGAILILERAGAAETRGREPYAIVRGGALGSDAYHLTDLDPDPTTLANLVTRSLADARMAPSEIDHVNVHGTATRSNDPLECRALRIALGPFADRVACSANKAQIGHTLGAAGAVELAITCLAMRHQFVPPTLNLEVADPACDLDGTPGTGRARQIRAALKLSLGFGGHLAAIVLSHRPAG
jgi:3-oxoacyl-[acyl-carrier-protein] synthase II